MNEVCVQDLIGKRVHDRNGIFVGRIEEIVVDFATPPCVKEYHIGLFGLIERLSAGQIGRSILHMLGARAADALIVPWEKLDLSDLARPRLTCSVLELQDAN